MRAVLPLLLLVIASLAGCAGDDDPNPLTDPFPLEVYRFSYPGSDVAVEGFEHGWLLRVANPSQITYRTTILPSGLEAALLGPVTITSGDAPQNVFLPARIENGITTAPPALTLAPGASGLFLVKATAYLHEDGIADVGLKVFAAPAARPEQITEPYQESWQVQVVAETTPVMAGDHVQTSTVGVWTNGTSFYTNIAELVEDPTFPAGFERDAFPTDTLAIYVYEDDREEQPAGSQDHCRFTTIPGYNALLKKQAEASTGVTLIRPDQAYTTEGNEDHRLYGEPLIFLNTIVTHDGAAGPEMAAPDPLAPCFGQRLEGLPV